MIFKVNQICIDSFSVVDSSGVLKPGIPLIDFTYNLYDPTGSESLISVTFVELGHGLYTASFTPDIIGSWTLIIYNSDYFPWGKIGVYQIFEEDFNTLAKQIDLLRALGLMRKRPSTVNCRQHIKLYNLNTSTSLHQVLSAHISRWSEQSREKSNKPQGGTENYITICQ